MRPRVALSFRAVAEHTGNDLNVNVIDLAICISQYWRPVRGMALTAHGNPAKACGQACRFRTTSVDCGSAVSNELGSPEQGYFADGMFNDIIRGSPRLKNSSSFRGLPLAMVAGILSA